MQEKSRMYMIQEKDRGVVPVPPFAVTKSEKHYLWSFRTEGPALEKNALSDIESEE